MPMLRDEARRQALDICLEALKPLDMNSSHGHGVVHLRATWLGLFKPNTQRMRCANAIGNFVFCTCVARFFNIYFVLFFPIPMPLPLFFPPS